MIGYLIDTNVISEIRKKDRANAGVVAWFDSVESEALFLSVLVVGELRHGIELIRRRDAVSAQHLDTWLSRLKQTFSDRMLPLSKEIAELWGTLGMAHPISPIDGLLAATAIHWDLTLVTRNVSHVVHTPAKLLNPFA
ncbi:MAG: type II toxin-antitoxin system VapC family toxin [Myxococcota bacterium]|nr:type II toxin-antitoxin system VapC family toxin [Myxococcota bacterium]